ncbi:hypothetical protein CTI12_AA311910 [Artemisia annua]|uniref:Uncharacterized protein n=1 Tax=Artemisia annua TaxID=35608 RepID=A0A2U1N3W0_ARTAN|nr:hypothetical protein CTI12_AA311910 [Artemisia annua]
MKNKVLVEGEQQMVTKEASQDAHTGKKVQNMLPTHFTVQVIYLPFCDSTEHQLHFLIDTDNCAHLHPKTPEAAEIFQRESGNVYSYLAEAEVESEKIIATVTRKANEQKADIKKRKTNENNAKKQLRRYLIHAPFEDQSMLASTVIPQSSSMAHALFEDDVNTSFGRRVKRNISTLKVLGGEEGSNHFIDTGLSNLFVLPEPWPFVSCANKNRLSNNQQRGGSSHGNMNHVNSATNGKPTFS